MRIVYCANSICYLGGVERITIAKANALAAIEGNEVWIVVAENRKQIALRVDERVHIVDLKVNYYIDDWKSRWNVLKGFVLKRIQHQKKLKQVLNDISPDIVISTGFSEKYFLPKLTIKSHPVFIREIHFVSNYRWLVIDPHSKWQRFKTWLADFFDYRISIRGYSRIILLTHEDKEKFWKNNDKALVIQNPLTVEHSFRSDHKNKIAIAVGRITKAKNFSSLIRSWKIVHEAHPDWKLEIWGGGDERERNGLEHLMKNLELQQVVTLKGNTYDIYSQYAQASMFVSTSLFEGFGLCIVESMSCGLPVVCYQCPSGPKDIITDGKDGFLVPLGNERMLADRIIYLIEHEEERLKMGTAAIEKSRHYSMDNIIQQWMALFRTLLDEKSKKNKR